MIVITTLNEGLWAVSPGDTFNLEVTDEMGSKIVISEEITEEKIIDFAASFRFALEDGTCAGFHLAGIFANRDELPKEIREAKTIASLTAKQRVNFLSSLGCSPAG